MGRILVVDDDNSVRDLLKEILEMNGHLVDMAENGKMALDLIKRNPYDLVIMDRNMPMMDGVQTVTIIRTNPNLSAMKIIMCTSASVVKEVDEAFKAGANDYLVKPIEIAKLLAKVNKHLPTP
ncbi:MAG: response regulator [Elusimicrobia bacterium]|nr:response regulator [Elusimicrobiota bacterium]